MDCNNCHKCLEAKPSQTFPGLSATNDRMILCSICGNKRCPKASNHDLECTNSNESGQRGSIYE